MPRKSSARIRGGIGFQPTPLHRYGLRTLNQMMEFPFCVDMADVVRHLLNNISISIDVVKPRPEYHDIGKITRMDVVGIGDQGEYIGQRLVNMGHPAIGLGSRYKGTIHPHPGPYKLPKIEVKDITKTAVVFVDDADRANDPTSDMEIVTAHYRHALAQTGSKGRRIHPMILRAALVSLSDRGSSWPLDGHQVALNILSEDTFSMYNYCLKLLGEIRPDRRDGRNPYLLLGLGNGGTYWAMDMYHRILDERGNQRVAKRLSRPVRVLDDKHDSSLYILDDNDEKPFDTDYFRGHLLDYRAIATIDDVCYTSRSMGRMRSVYLSAAEQIGNLPPMALISMVNLSDNSLPVKSPVYINKDG